MIPRECMLKPGDCVIGQQGATGDATSYKIVQKLGEGGFGVVYLVVSNADNRQYALKVLKLWTLCKRDQDNYRKRFNRAYRVMSTPCKHLVHSIDCGEIDGNPFYVMEYCPQGDLLDYFEKIKGGQREQEVVRCMYQVLLGLAELHGKGMVHRDIKPENVMLHTDGTIALNDFDLAGDENNRFTTQYVMGIPKQSFYTKAFAPPEQVNPIRGKKEVMVMPTIDIFAFAVMNYQLLTGIFPFGPIRTDSDMAVYYAHANNDEWNRVALGGTKNADFWEKTLEPCLKGNYQKRLGNVKTLISQFETKFPDICKKQINVDTPGGSPQMKNLSNYPRMHDFGLMVVYGDKRGVPSDGLLRKGKKMLTIGRHSGDVRNDIELYGDDNRYISRRHATLEWDENDRHWYIRDGQFDMETHSWTRSKNGTHVNSREADFSNGILLEVDDIIYVGEMRIAVTGYDERGWMYYGGQIHKNRLWT